MKLFQPVLIDLRMYSVVDAVMLTITIKLRSLTFLTVDLFDEDASHYAHLFDIKDVNYFIHSDINDVHPHGTAMI